MHLVNQVIKMQLVNQVIYYLINQMHGTQFCPTPKRAGSESVWRTVDVWELLAEKLQMKQSSYK